MKTTEKERAGYLKRMMHRLSILSVMQMFGHKAYEDGYTSNDGPGAPRRRMKLRRGKRTGAGKKVFKDKIRARIYKQKMKERRSA